MKLKAHTKADYTVTSNGKWRWEPSEIILDADLPEATILELCNKQLRVLAAPDIRDLKIPAAGEVKRPDGVTTSTITGTVVKVGTVQDGKYAGLPMYQGGTLILRADGIMAAKESTNVLKLQKERIADLQATNVAQADKIAKLEAQMAELLKKLS